MFDILLLYLWLIRDIDGLVRFRTRLRRLIIRVLLYAQLMLLVYIAFAIEAFVLGKDALMLKRVDICFALKDGGGKR